MTGTEAKKKIDKLNTCLNRYNELEALKKHMDREKANHTTTQTPEPYYNNVSVQLKNYEGIFDTLLK